MTQRAVIKVSDMNKSHFLQNQKSIPCIQARIFIYKKNANIWTNNINTNLLVFFPTIEGMNLKNLQSSWNLWIDSKWMKMITLLWRKSRPRFIHRLQIPTLPTTEFHGKNYHWNCLVLFAYSLPGVNFIKALMLACFVRWQCLKRLRIF